MQGLVRLTYWLGWLFLGLTVIARILTYTSLVDPMITWGVLPRNFLEMAFFSFLVCIATAMMERQKP
jgi:hypothetical protein